MVTMVVHPFWVFLYPFCKLYNTKALKHPLNVFVFFFHLPIPSNLVPRKKMTDTLKTPVYTQIPVPLRTVSLMGGGPWLIRKSHKCHLVCYIGGICLPVIHLKLCAESGRWRMNNSPSPKFLPSCSPLISPSPPWDSSSTLRRVYGWPLLECLRTWDEDDSETLDKN